MTTALEFYLHFGLIWTGFMLGCLWVRCGLRLRQVIVCLLFNLAIWPAMVAFLLFVVGREQKNFASTTASSRRRRKHKG